jgi:hypothetical protein
VCVGGGGRGRHVVLQFAVSGENFGGCSQSWCERGKMPLVPTLLPVRMPSFRVGGRGGPHMWGGVGGDMSSSSVCCVR